MSATPTSTPEPTPAGSSSGLRRLVPGRRRPADPTAEPSPSGRRRVAVIGAIALPLLLGGCQLPTFYGYRGVTSSSHDESLLWEAVFITSLVVLALVFALIGWAVVRYRRRSDDIPRQFQYHIPLEIFYTIVPIVMVLVLFGFTVVTENKVDNVVPNPALSVKVTAFQWGWRFDYTNQHVYVEGVRTEDPDPVGLHGQSCPQSAPTANDCLGPGLVLPVGETVGITLVSNDVIHGFYVPQFNFSRYALPGVTNHFDFHVQTSGIYRAQCTQLCGLYHSQMFFHVVALPPAQFQAWLHGSQPQPAASAGPVPTSTTTASASYGPSGTSSTTGTTTAIPGAGASSSPSTSTGTRVTAPAPAATSSSKA